MIDGVSRANGRRSAVRRGGDATPARAGRRRAARRRSRRRFSSRSPRGSTGSAKRAKSRRSARCWGESSPIRCCATVAPRTRRAASAGGARPAGRGRPPVRRRRAPEAAYRFKHALIQDAAYDSLLKKPPADAAPPRRRGVARRPRRRARSDRPSFRRGRPRRSRHRMVGQGRRPGAPPLGLPGGDRPSRQGDRNGGQGGGRQASGTSGSNGNLHVAYGNALFAARGHGRARDDAGLRKSPRVRRRATMPASERLTADYGLWVGSLVRGELSAMRACAGFSRRRRGRYPIRPRPASPTA